MKFFITLIDDAMKELFYNLMKHLYLKHFKEKEFRIYTEFFQLLRKLMFNFSLFFFYSSFSYFRKSLTVTFPCFRAKSLEIFIIFLESTKLKIVLKKKLFFLNKAFRSYYDLFQVNWLVQN